MNKYQDIFTDIISHADDFRKAMEIAKHHAEVRDPDIDDKAYWDKQIKTYNRIEELAKLMTGQEVFVPVGDTNEARFDSILDHASEKAAIFASFGVDSHYSLNNFTAAEQTVLAFGYFYSQVANGGIQQYISNGLATETGSNGRPAHRILREITVLFADENTEVSTAIKNMLRMVSEHLDIDSYSEQKFDRVTSTFEPIEKTFYELDREQVFGFFMTAAEGLDQSKRPFIEGTSKPELEVTLKM